MDNIDYDVLDTALRWSQAGCPTTLGTVVKTWGSAPRPLGSMLALRSDGRLVGSISGGCIEDDLIEQIREGGLTAGNGLPRVLTYGVNADEAQRFGLPCGGTVQLVLEPVTGQSDLPALMAAIKRHGRVLRRLDLATGRTTVVIPGLSAAAASSGASAALSTAAATAAVESGAVSGSGAATQTVDDRFHFDGTCLSMEFGTRYRLLIIGAGQLSRYLANLAIPLGYEVIVCDPREEYTAEWHIEGCTLSREMPDDVVLQVGVDERTAIVALTHDPKLDDLALIDALQSPAFYVGAIGSRANRQRRAERLAMFDVSKAQLARLHSPVGLNIGAKTPAEIAVSIVAEMTAWRYRVAVPLAATPVV